MDYSPWVEREILAVFEGCSNSKTGVATPTKIGVYASYINHYLHEFFGLIPIDYIF